MSDFITEFRDSRWSSTKFWLVVGMEAYSCVALANKLLSQDNFVFMSLSLAGAYLGVNLLQHRTYASAETAQAESAAVTKRALNASDAATEQQEDRIQGEARNGVPK